MLLAAFFIIFFISVWAATKAERIFGKDGRQITIDEACGMLASLFWVSRDVKLFIVAFVLFRFFDVVKLPPAKKAENLKAGWGVTIDDVVAGIYANLTLNILLWLKVF